MKDDPRYDPKEFRKPSYTQEQYDRDTLIFAVVLAVCFVFVVTA